ncbi:hypothetical protein JQN58_38635 [Aneurinibacillus sp. BA2021]|nr:hypothetical protein [Aneurinibacillus sp. BA2021]
MDVFERVREVNRGAGLSEEHLTSARARLLTGIDAGVAAERARRVRRPLFLVAGAVAGVAAATAGVVMLSQLTAPEPRVEAVPVQTLDPRPHGDPLPRPSATSGTGATEPFPGTTPQAGQYLQIRCTSDALYFRDGVGGVFRWPRSGDPQTISAAVMRSHAVEYVPADRAGTWVSRYGPSMERVELFGTDTEVMRWTWDSLAPYRPEVSELQSVGGRQYGDLPPVGGPGYYDAAPRDPQGLLDYWSSFFAEAGSARDDSVLMEILSQLKQNIAPPDVRSAYLSALQLTGRATVDSTAGSEVTYRVEFTDIDARTETITIDTTTGWVVESAIWYVKQSGQDLVPSGVPDERTTYDVSIVDAIP